MVEWSLLKGTQAVLLPPQPVLRAILPEALPPLLPKMGLKRDLKIPALRVQRPSSLLFIPLLEGMIHLSAQC